MLKSPYFPAQCSTASSNHQLPHDLEKAGYLVREDRLVGGKNRNHYRASALGEQSLEEARARIRELVVEVVHEESPERLPTSRNQEARVRPRSRIRSAGLRADRQLSPPSPGDSVARRGDRPDVAPALRRVRLAARVLVREVDLQDAGSYVLAATSRSSRWRRLRSPELPCPTRSRRAP
jgi:hypothetical protein